MHPGLALAGRAIPTIGRRHCGQAHPWRYNGGMGGVPAAAGSVSGRVFVTETGLRNGAYGADKFGFKDLAEVRWNLDAPALYEYALAGHEAVIVQGGAILPLFADFRQTKCRRW